MPAPTPALRGFARMALGLLLACTCLGAPMQARGGEEFVVRDFKTHVVDGVIQLDADIDFELPDVLLDALTNGVELHIVLEVTVVRKRGWWLDTEVANLTQRFSLIYHALSRQYLLENHNTGVRVSYPSLGSALFAMGLVRDYPMLDASLLNDKATYLASMRVRLAYEDLPIPLRMRAYVSADWRPSSNWYQWYLP